MNFPTPRQKEAIRAIHQYMTDHNGVSPAYKDVAEILAVRENAAVGLVAVLERKGYVTRIRGVARSTRLTDQAEKYL